MIKKFPKTYLVETLFLPNESDEFVIDDEMVDHGRWSITHSLVFRDLDGSTWLTSYRVGSTEYQDEEPWEYDGEFIEAVRVEAQQVCVDKWIPIKEA